MLCDGDASTGGSRDGGENAQAVLLNWRAAGECAKVRTSPLVINDVLWHLSRLRGECCGQYGRMSLTGVGEYRRGEARGLGRRKASERSHLTSVQVNVLTAAAGILLPGGSAACGVAVHPSRR